jgi:hypothetical protein
MVKIVVNRTFANRGDLDDFVRTRFGDNRDANAKHTIEASTEELTALGLSADTTVFGVRVVATSIDTEGGQPVGFNG